VEEGKQETRLSDGGLLDNATSLAERSRRQWRNSRQTFGDGARSVSFGGRGGRGGPTRHWRRRTRSLVEVGVDRVGERSIGEGGIGEIGRFG